MATTTATVALAAPLLRPRIAIGLAGSDLGRSGIGVYVREVLPRIAQLAITHGGRVYVFGTKREMEAYSDALVDVSPYVLPASHDRPAMSAAWYTLRANALAADLGANVVLHLAGNRRVSGRDAAIGRVAVVHDLAQLHVSDKYDAARMLYVRNILSRSLSGVDAIATPSSATAADVRAHVAGSRPTVIPNGVDIQRFTPLAENDPRRRTAFEVLGARRPYIFYPARFELPGKNHLRLLRAYAASDAARTHDLVLVGADWGALADVRTEIGRLGLGERVRLPGFIDDAALPIAMASASAIAMVGLHEGFGLPALEGLACGIPVVAANTGSLPEVLGPLAAYANPRNENDLAAAIDRVVTDGVLRARARFEGPDRAASFSWDRVATDLFSLCLQVMR